MTSRQLFFCLPSLRCVLGKTNILGKYLRSRWCFSVHRKCVRIHNITIYDFLFELYAMCVARNSLRIVFQFISPKIKVSPISCNSRVLVRNLFIAKLSSCSVKCDGIKSSFSASCDAQKSLAGEYAFPATTAPLVKSLFVRRRRP